MALSLSVDDDSMAQSVRRRFSLTPSCLHCLHRLSMVCPPEIRGQSEGKLENGGNIVRRHSDYDDDDAPILMPYDDDNDLKHPLST